MEQCPICNEKITYYPLGNRDAYQVKCLRCGNYNLTRTALVNLRSIHFTNRQIANIYGWLNENPKYEITSKSVDYLSQIQTPSFSYRADALLKQIERETAYAGHFVELKSSWIRVGWCINDHELYEILNFLEETDRILDSGEVGLKSLKIRPEGWAHLESLRKPNASENQGFVAMWFSEGMQKVYDNAISIAISNAGYVPHRVDLREHNEKIDDEIISQIRTSKFVLADFTGHRGGVYFEAGFAKGLGLEVFWTCREDDLDNLHFDIRQYNCIVWKEDDLNDFIKKITNRITAVVGPGKA